MEISFDRNKFLIKKKPLEVKNILNILDTNLIDYKIKSNYEIINISSISQIRKKSLLFIEKKLNVPFTNFSSVTVILDNQDSKNSQNFENFLIVKDLSKAYNILVNKLYCHEDNLEFKDEFILVNNSLISKYSKIHPSSKLYNNCVIGRGVEIGKNCIIKNNVVIKNSIIKNDVIISDNSTIGSTGFGFNLNSLGSKNLNPQIGIVYIDNNVHIGSGCTIDRGKIDITYIGKNCMIDNLVHVGHNVIIQDNACIAAQTGISGSVNIGKNLISGGQSGYAGHISIGNNVKVAAKSGVTKNLIDNSAVAGFPAIDINAWKKMMIKQKK